MTKWNAVPFALALGLFAATPTQAQVAFGDAGIGLFGGVALPTGDFADDDQADEESGFAELGFMLGADAYLPLGSTPLGWITSASINSFGVDGDEFFGPDSDVSRYWLIPVMTGVNYPFVLSPTMTLSPMAQVGLNLALGPNAEDATGAEADFKTSFSLAFSLGANLSITDNLGATLRYVNGGAPEREIEIEGFDDVEKDSPMSFLQLGLVYILR